MRKYIFFLIFIVLVSCKPQSQLPELGKISSFSYQSEAGKSFSSQELKGMVWVADFIFTTCPKECPLMSQEMAKIQDQTLQLDKLKFVSFTVDPETDTPEVLKKYAKAYGAKSGRWIFLTGSREKLYQMTQKDFHLPVIKVGQKSEHDHHNHQAMDDSQMKAMKSPGQSSSPFLHSQKFVLIDQNLMIRGYYESTQSDDMQKLVKDIKLLVSS